MKYVFEKNPVTGLPETAIQLKLVSEDVSDPIAYTNAKKETKHFRLITVEFENTAGEREQARASINGTNYNFTVAGKDSKGRVVQPLKKDTTYLGRVTIAPNKAGQPVPYINMSHLIGGVNATLESFGFEEAPVATMAAATV